MPVFEAVRLQRGRADWEGQPQPIRGKLSWKGEELGWLVLNDA